MTGKPLSEKPYATSHTVGCDLSFELYSTIQILHLEERSSEILAHHSDYVYHVAVDTKNDIISCGEDHTVAFWDGKPFTLRQAEDCSYYISATDSDSTSPAKVDTSLSERVVLCVPGQR